MFLTDRLVLPSQRFCRCSSIPHLLIQVCHQEKESKSWATHFKQHHSKRNGETSKLTLRLKVWIISWSENLSERFLLASVLLLSPPPNMYLTGVLLGMQRSQKSLVQFWELSGNYSWEVGLRILELSQIGNFTREFLRINKMLREIYLNWSYLNKK